MGFFRMTSWVCAFICAVIIIVLWLVAAHDRGSEDGNVHKCHGCYQIWHKQLADDSGDLNKWMRANRDPYPLLIAFGVVLCFFWLVTAVLGIISNTVMMGKIVHFFHSGY